MYHFFGKFWSFSVLGSASFRQGKMLNLAYENIMGSKGNIQNTKCQTPKARVWMLCKAKENYYYYHHHYHRLSARLLEMKVCIVLTCMWFFHSFMFSSQVFSFPFAFYFLLVIFMWGIGAA